MSDGLWFTIRYSDAGDGWFMTQIAEVPSAISQGRTRADARENVLDALRLILTPEPEQTADPDREPFFVPVFDVDMGLAQRGLRGATPEAAFVAEHGPLLPPDGEG